ncbi:MAG: type III-B CRISPR module RAMP protein Cmr6 [Saprospiraceae bacterium]|nr:type III-B CRISPR module RAMP protein Cmr6 [Saprospiraceae bacterium]
MPKGVLKISRTNKGKVFVEIDKLNGRPPMPISYVVLPDTDLNGKECQYEVDEKGIFKTIKVEGNVVWSRNPPPSVTLATPVGQKQVVYTEGSKFQDTFSPAHTFLPQDVQNLGLTDIDNFSLKLQKAARYETTLNRDKFKFIFFKNDPRERVFLEIKANYGHLQDNFTTLCQRQAQHAERLFPSNSRKIELHPQWRFVLGLGGESVYETNMTLHHTYGMPYFPSSSIKGVLRGWVISQIFTQEDNVKSYNKDKPLENAEHRAITESPLFCTIFGCPKESQKKNSPTKDLNALKFIVQTPEGPKWKSQEHQGIITFFDGLPTVAPVIKTDVMNVHYKDWYKDIGYSAPTDTQRTNPIHFLTVSNENNLRFQTYIGTNNNMKLGEFGKDYGIFIKNTPLNSDSTILDLVAYWLKKALSLHGIGAKTAVGYGYMK